MIWIICIVVLLVLAFLAWAIVAGGAGFSFRGKGGPK